MIWVKGLIDILLLVVLVLCLIFVVGLKAIYKASLVIIKQFLNNNKEVSS